MENKFEEFLQISFEGFDAPNYLSAPNKERFNNSVIMMLEMQKLLKKCVEIAAIVQIPLKLVQGLNEYIDDFIQLTRQLDSLRTPTENSDPTKIFDRIHTTHANFFEIGSKQLGFINAISNYYSFFDSSEIINLERLNSELRSKNARVDEILQRLEIPSAERVLSAYSTMYGKNEGDNNNKSKFWIRAGIATILTFITAIFLSINYNWFPATLTLTSKQGSVVNSHEILNIPILITKIVLVSLFIFFIVFCFRQYSVFKHLSIVNQQKKLALDSYDSFAAAIGNDTEAKKILLMSLAKSIHESLYTGFLSSKQVDQSFIQNFDISKIASGIK